MFVKKSLALLFGVALLPVLMNCECDSHKRLLVDEALADRFHVSDSSDNPADNMFADMTFGDDPKQGELSVDFGQVDVNTVSTRYLFVHNSGTQDLRIVGADFEAGSNPAFAISCQDQGQFVADCPYSSESVLVIGPAQNLVVRLDFAPQEVGSHAGALVISSNAKDYPTIVVELAGEGITPEIQVCISDCTGAQDSTECQGATEVCNDVADGNLNIQFGEVTYGEAAMRLVTVRNIGTQDLNLSGIPIAVGDVNQFSTNVSTGAIPGSLAPEEEAVIEVTYQPATGGDHAASMQVLSDDVNESEVVVDLNGSGLAPAVCPDPFSIDFGNVAVGEPQEETFSLTNCGLLDLVVENMVISDTSSADFTLVDPPTTPLTLAPAESVEVRVLYSPDAAGSDLGGVDIYSNDPVSDPTTHLSGTVALRGNGIVRECQIQATPFTLNFGGVVQNQSDVMDLIISNQGNDLCTYHDAVITTNTASDEFSIADAPVGPVEFGPGEMLVVQVQYAPDGLGVDNGILTITGNDADGADMEVPLMGEGVETAACQLTMNPAWLQYGTTKLNTTRALFFTLKNEGNASCTVDEMVLAQNPMQAMLGGGDFEITLAPPVPFVVARRGQPGDQQEIEVTFAPTSLNLHSSTFWVHTPDMADPLLPASACFHPVNNVAAGPGDGCAYVTGMSAESDIEVVPTELDFGVVTVGCNSPEMHITVYNLGTIGLEVNDIYLEDPVDPNFEIRQAPAVPFTLQGGASFEVRLRYHPQDTSVHRSALYIVSDASNDDMLIVPLFGRGTLISEQTDVFHQLDQVRSDVLFVVDNSGSMGWAQNELSSNFSSFISWATSLDVDFHIGVITTEVNDPETGEGTPPRDIYPGVLVQAPSRPKIITNATPDISNAFSENVHVGTCCSDEQEAGLEAAWMALSQPLVDDPASNGGFLREDAKLYIVCISDEQDQSRGNPDFYVDFFSNIKGPRNTDMMKVSAIVGDSPDGCGNDTAASGSRYIEVANQTGGIFQSICTSNWSQALSSLGIDAFTAIREFPLSRPADAGTIVVTVNGGAVGQCATAGCADGWTYYPDSNTIYFGDDVVPDRGDEITVSYTALCL